MDIIQKNHVKNYVLSFFWFGLNTSLESPLYFALDHDHDHHPHIATLSDKLERVINLSSCGI
jgi:hypothetical protein